MHMYVPQYHTRQFINVRMEAVVMMSSGEEGRHDLAVARELVLVKHAKDDPVHGGEVRWLLEPPTNRTACDTARRVLGVPKDARPDATERDRAALIVAR